MSIKTPNDSEADKFCNPLVEVEQCAAGLKKWAAEKQKPKKEGNYSGKTYCNDQCHKFKSPKPNWGKNPYATHVTCKKCDGIWMEKTSCKVGKNGQLRCPCCNILVRVTARRKRGGETAKLYQGEQA